MCPGLRVLCVRPRRRPSSPRPSATRSACAGGASRVASSAAVGDRRPLFGVMMPWIWVLPESMHWWTADRRYRLRHPPRGWRPRGERDRHRPHQSHCRSAVTRIRQAAADPHVVGIVRTAPRPRRQDGVRASPGTRHLGEQSRHYGRNPAFEIDDAEWQRFFEVNVMSGVRFTRPMRRAWPGAAWDGWCSCRANRRSTSP